MKAATFEGMTPEGGPSERLLNFHTSIARGGIGLTTLSYCTTEPDGRIMDSMMWLDDKIKDDLSDLISKVKKSGAKVSGQVTHCGHFSQLKTLERDQPPKGPYRYYGWTLYRSCNEPK